MQSSSIEAEYQARNDALLPKERVARALAMFQWSREMMGRQILREAAVRGVELSQEELKLRVGLRVYRGEPAVVALIERRLDELSG